MKVSKTYCGFAVIIGCSNVGKSTLFNKLIGKKISITSNRSQTTLYPIIGIRTEKEYQTIYVDTPGGVEYIQKNKINIQTLLNTTVNGFVNFRITLVIFVVNHLFWTVDNEIILNKIREEKLKVLLVINKIDKISEKTKLLPYIKYLTNKMNFLDIIPVSSKIGTNINFLLEKVTQLLPESIHRFPKNYISNSSKIFIVSEIIREKIIRLLGAELPYITNIKIEHLFLNKKNIYDISGTIFVKKDRHKKIVIGNYGSKIKAISTQARTDIQKTLLSSVYLNLWVKTNIKR